MTPSGAAWRNSRAVSSAPPMPVPSVLPGSATQPTFIRRRPSGSPAPGPGTAAPPPRSDGSMCSANTFRTIVLQRVLRGPPRRSRSRPAVVAAAPVRPLQATRRCPPRPRRPATTPWPVQNREDSTCQPTFPTSRHGGVVRHDHRGAARLRLDDRDAEPLTHRRVQQHVHAGVQHRHRLRRVGLEVHPVRVGPADHPARLVRDLRAPAASPSGSRPPRPAGPGGCGRYRCASGCVSRKMANASNACWNPFLDGLRPLLAATIPTRNASSDSPIFSRASARSTGRILVGVDPVRAIQRRLVELERLLELRAARTWTSPSGWRRSRTTAPPVCWTGSWSTGVHDTMSSWPPSAGAAPTRPSA